jgi:hypothetical protein
LSSVWVCDMCLILYSRVCKNHADLSVSNFRSIQLGSCLSRLSKRLQTPKKNRLLFNWKNHLPSLHFSSNRVTSVFLSIQ